MKKIYIVFMFFGAIFLILSGLVLKEIYFPKQRADLCGDNICDAREMADTNLCPSDCSNSFLEGVGQLAGDQSRKVVDDREAMKLDSYNDSPFGFHPIFVPYVDDERGRFDFAADIGVKWDRAAVYFSWILVQPDLSKKTYDWSNYDRYIAAMPSSIYSMANITIGNPIGMKQYDDYAKSAKTFLPKDESAYSEFVQAVVERYDGDGVGDMPDLKNPIKYWQIDNEPPHGTADYAQFLKISYLAVKKADPKAKVIIGGVPGMPPISNYLSSFDRFYLPILEDLSRMDGQYFDIMDFHWYGNATGDYKYVKAAKDHIDKKMKALELSYDEIWITEMGTYSGDPKLFPRLSPIDYDLQTERQQAVDVVKRYVYPISLGVKKIFMAFGLMEGFKNDEGYFDFTGFIYDGKYGDDQGRGVKKLSYYTYKKMTETLEGADWNNIQTIQEKDGIYVYKLTKNNNPIWVAWNDNEDKKNVIISMDKNIKNVKITEAVPRYETGKEVMDYESAFTESRGVITQASLHFELGDKPVFIEEER